MDLIERYIHAVGRYLPIKNRSDIQTELQSTLVDTLDARVGEGEATQEQVIALLKEFGSPEKVAASYWPEGQYLVGPRLFPLFRLVVGIALSVFIIVQLVLLGVTLVFGQETVQWLEFLGGLAGSILGAFGSIVLVFAILQRFDVNPEMENEDWDPRELPALSEEETISRGGMVAEITFSLIFLAILTLLPDKIGVWTGLGGEFVPNPVLMQYLPLLILVLLLGVGLDVVLLWRGRWETFTRIIKIGFNLFGIFVLVMLIGGHNAWLMERGYTGFLPAVEALSQVGSASPDSIQVLVMMAFQIAFVVALIVTAAETVVMIYRFVRGWVSPGKVPAMAAQ